MTTRGINIESYELLRKPRDLWEELPISNEVAETVTAGRQQIQKILDGEDTRKIVVVGPCSVHNPDEALEYARRLKELADKLKERLLLVMRVYFEKPRTTVGWKGMINDPDLDDSFNVEKGLRMARKLLLDISEQGVYCATETLEPITPQYLAGIVSWAAIGARTTESQTHRQLASGLSMPVGFKNGTDGRITTAVNAIRSAASPHHFIGVNPDGEVCVYTTRGNRYGHLILRGGGGRPNYDVVSIRLIKEQLADSGINTKFMIDCSHDNSGKDYRMQPVVLRDVIQQIRNGEDSVIGVMLESNLNEGKQKIPEDKSQLKPGVSVTDSCICWDTTVDALTEAYEGLVKD